MAQFLRAHLQQGNANNADFWFDTAVSDVIDVSAFSVAGGPTAIGFTNFGVVVIVNFDGPVAETAAFGIADNGSIAFEDSSTLGGDVSGNLLALGRITSVQTSTGGNAQINFNHPLTDTTDLATCIAAMTIATHALTLVSASVGDSFCVVSSSSPVAAVDAFAFPAAVDNNQYFGESYGPLDVYSGTVAAGITEYIWEGSGGTTGGGSGDWSYGAAAAPAPVATSGGGGGGGVGDFAMARRRPAKVAAKQPIAARVREWNWEGEGGATGGGEADWQFEPKALSEAWEGDGGAIGDGESDWTYVSRTAFLRAEDERILEIYLATVQSN